MMNAGLKELFLQKFGHHARFIAQAPGRVNLIGEHTDYNEGLVLPMAIDRKIAILFTPRTDSLINVYSHNFQQNSQFELGKPLLKSDIEWIDYFKAAASVLGEAGYSLKGMDAVVYGNIPVASGLSSSAAVEVACLLAMLTSAEAEIPRALELARLAQRAEREFIGLQCGLMDQFISAAAIQGYALKIDCQTMEFDSIPIPSSLSIVVADTKLSRTLAGSAYNERCTECDKAFRMLNEHLKENHSSKATGPSSTSRDQLPEFPELRSFSDIDLEVVQWAQGFLPEKLHRRIKHVATENLRVALAADALISGDFSSLGNLFDESHASLKYDYEVSSDGLDRVVNIMKQLPGCYGARLTGAGFGGCAIAAVDSELASEFIAAAEKAFQTWNPEPSFFLAIPSSGATIQSITSP
ncbi:MAG: galactokinase [Planctomycetota bacterium]